MQAKNIVLENFVTQGFRAIFQQGITSKLALKRVRRHLITYQSSFFSYF